MTDITERLAAIRGLEPVSPNQQKKLDITHLKKGGYLELEGETWMVKKVYYYLDVKWSDFSKRKKDYWVCELEIFSLNTGKTSYLEWEKDDDIEIYLTTDLVKLRDIKFNGRAIKHEDLVEIAEEEEGDLTVMNTEYAYSDDDTWAALFMKDKNEAHGIPMRTYEFESDSGLSLSIETWHEDEDERPDREAFLSQPVGKKKISILQPQAAS